MVRFQIQTPGAIQKESWNNNELLQNVNGSSDMHHSFHWNLTWSSVQKCTSIHIKVTLDWRWVRSQKEKKPKSEREQAPFSDFRSKTRRQMNLADVALRSCSIQIRQGQTGQRKDSLKIQITPLCTNTLLWDEEHKQRKLNFGKVKDVIGKDLRTGLCSWLCCVLHHRTHNN